MPKRNPQPTADCREITLSDGTIVTIDAADVPVVLAHPWRSNIDGYIVYNKIVDGVYGCFLLHRVLTGAPKGMSVDHWDRDRRHNWRGNLRIGTQSQNLANRPGWQKAKSSRFKGVSWCKARNKWQAYIKVNWKKIHLGYFADEIEAARAYDAAALKFFGEFAYTNDA